uniref:CD48 antigen-like n=1 Tax=Geotrypetes seraphini TaxID=260995 RepID=A0A6P8QXQ5_GEOSA|nr:CD48 antigen-like [Geotrypetes seraphini]
MEAAGTAVRHRVLTPSYHLRQPIPVLGSMTLRLLCWVSALLRISGADERNRTAATGQSVPIHAFHNLSVYEKGLLECNFYRRSDNKNTDVAILSYYSGNENATFTDNYKNRIDFNKSSGSISLKNLSREDEGDYICQWRTNLNDIKKELIHLHIQDPVSTPQITFSRNESNIILQCDASGDDINFAWKKDEKSLPSNYVLQDNNKTLLIRNANASDAGQFSCTVQNASGKKTATYKHSLKESRHHWFIFGSVVVVLCAVLMLLLAPFLTKLS